jgi:ribosomal protein S19E (S16A)
MSEEEYWAARVASINRLIKMRLDAIRRFDEYRYGKTDNANETVNSVHHESESNEDDFK